MKTAVFRVLDECRRTLQEQLFGSSSCCCCCYGFSSSSSSSSSSPVLSYVPLQNQYQTSQRPEIFNMASHCHTLPTSGQKIELLHFFFGPEENFKILFFSQNSFYGVILSSSNFFFTNFVQQIVLPLWKPLVFFILKTHSLKFLLHSISCKSEKSCHIRLLKPLLNNLILTSFSTLRSPATLGSYSLCEDSSV